ncbi:MAG: sugar kinase [Hyphomicrobiales bacterium]
MISKTSSDKLDLLCIGEAMAELRDGAAAGLTGDFKVGFAGDTYNTAVYCKRQMGDSGKVGYFTRVGQDPLSVEFVVRVKEEGIDPSYITTDKQQLIGIYSVVTDKDGERSFSYWRHSSAARQLFSHDEAIRSLPPARIYYLSGITLAILDPAARRRVMDHLAEVTKTTDTLVAFDSNYRPKLWESKAVAKEVMDEMWEIADIGFPSIDDELLLYGDTNEEALLDRFAKFNWKAFALKRGARGPVSLSLSGDELPVFPPAPKVLDTTAAGDSFNGGYFAAYLQGEDEATCLLRGHEVASRVITQPGAIVSGE